MIPVWQHCAFAHWFLFYIYFPTCQGRVVRFYVSLFSSSSFSFFSSASSSVSLSCCDSVCSVWHVGPQLRSCEFSVACWTSTAILWVQCGVPDPNRDPACSVWRAGSQLWSRVFSAVCRTSTAILRVQCGVPDPNRDPACSVWRAGPQLWSRVFSAVCRTSTAILRVQCGIPDLNRDYASSVWRAGPHLWWKGLVVVARCHKISQIECQEICLQEGQKECVNVMVDLRRAGGLEDDDWWLAIYVMLTRARKLENLILLGMTDQVEDLLRRGPPAYLRELTDKLEAKGAATLERLQNWPVYESLKTSWHLTLHLDSTACRRSDLLE